MHLLDHARGTQRYVGFCAVPTAVGSDEICMYEILWLEFKLDIKLQFLKILFNPNWHEAGHFYPPFILGLDFVS